MMLAWAVSQGNWKFIFWLNERFSKDSKLYNYSTPDDNSNSFSELKITYEPQSNYDVASITPRTDIKNSPPSSPSSEITESHKRNRLTPNDGSKDIKMHPTHMLGNQLNPSSSVAQKMSDQLFMEMEAHSAYTSSSMDSNTQLIGPVFPGKQLNSVSYFSNFFFVYRWFFSV